MEEIYKIKKEGKEKAKCKGCGKEYAIGGRQYGTSTLGRHLVKCTSSQIAQYHDVSNMIIDNSGKLRSRKPDPKAARQIMSMALIEHNLPFKFVEYKRITQYIRLYHPDYVPISKKTATSDVFNLYESQKVIMKQTLQKVPGRICLTSDLWTASTSEGYICLTAHFVDEKWTLNSKILSFCYMPPPHSGFELSKKVFEFLKEWGIDKKVFSLTLDNASANDCMQDYLKEQLNLQNSLLCGGEFFHIRCCAHILHLIVKEGLTVASPALHKIRDSVKYVKGSDGRMKHFWRCIEQVGNIDTGVGLRLDVATRWNSTYLMLDSALKYRRAFCCLQLNDSNYKYCPSMDEWGRAEKICKFLNPFYTITNLMSRSSYPTSNLYFLQV